MYEGEIVADLDPKKITTEELGLTWQERKGV